MATRNTRNNRGNRNISRNTNNSESPSAPNGRRRGKRTAVRARNLKNPFTKPGSQQTFVPGSDDSSGNPMWYYEDYIDGSGGGPGGPSNPGNNVQCLVGCCYQNLNQSNYQCVHPAGSGNTGCANAWEIYYGLAACQAGCQGGGCFCDEIGQGDSGNSGWVAEYLYLPASMCSQYSIGSLGCCSTSSCNCNNCDGGSFCN